MAISACGKKDPTLVSLEGELTGLGNDTLYVYGDDKLYPHTDTIVVTEDRFEAQLHTDTLVSVKLLLPDGAEHPLYFRPGDRIRINGTAGNPQAITVSGNPANEELTAFLQTLNELGKPSKQAMQEQAEAFIKEHPNSLASLHVLETCFVQDTTPDYSRIRQLIGSMSGEMRDRPYTTDLSVRLKEQAETATGKTVPPFSLPGSDGKTVNRSTFRDKYLLIHFWASWDSLSLERIDMYRRIYRKEKKSEDFALLGFSLDIDSMQWAKAIERDTLEWTQCCELKGWNSKTVEQMAIQTLPANLLLNPYGRIEGRDLDEQTIENMLKAEREKKKQRKKNAGRLHNVKRR